jgi:membrane fusion protein, multidrug efflux system
MVVGPDDVAVSRDVVLGELQGSFWMIREGLTPGDRVIVDGIQKVRPGSPVRIAAATP